MKLKLPEGLRRFDIPDFKLRSLPSHLAWYNASPVRTMTDDESRIGLRQVRPFTTLEVWLIDQGVVTSRANNAYFLDSRRRKNPMPMSVWRDRIKSNYPALTASPLPLWQSRHSSLVKWLSERNLTPPAHIFSPASDFVAEELPTSNTSYINPPATHAY